MRIVDICKCYYLSDPGSVCLGGAGNEVLPLSLRVLQEDVDHLVGVDDDAVAPAQC